MSFHIVIAGDFAGANAVRPTKPIEVDRDNLENVLARVKPVIELPVPGPDGKPMTVTVTSLDDFHPDSLYRRLPLFQAIRDTVTAEPEPVAPAPPTQGSGETSKPAGGGFLDDILETTEERFTAQAGPVRSGWDAALHRIATESAQPKPTAAQEQRAADAERASNLVMRAILRSPQFQAVESAWRGLDFLVRRLDTDSEFKVSLFDVSKSGLSAQLAKQKDGQWNVVLANYTFGPGDADIATLRALAQAAKTVETPAIAGGHPALVGCAEIADLADPDEWRELPAPTLQAWAALRRSPDAAWVALALPRILMRLPYGASGSTCEEFAFEEMEAGEGAEALPWSNPIFACAGLIGESWMKFGEANAQRELDGMLSYSWRQDGVPQFQPVGEALLTDRAVEAILDRGLMPLMSSKHGSELRLPRFQSLADPQVALEFPAG